MPLKLNSSGGGSVTLDVPSTASTFTVTVPAATATLATTTGGNTVEFGAGSASAPSLTTTGDTNTGQFFPAADTVAWTTGGTERARITSGGDLLVNTTTSRAKVTIKGATSDIYANSGIALEQASNTNRWNILAASTNDFYFGYNGVDKGYIRNTDGAYISLSDRSAKKNIEDISYGLSAVMALRSCSYNMSSDEEGSRKSLGFIAQEVLSVVPESVFEMQGGMYGMDKSSIIPVLVKAIQEQQVQIEELKARVAALEAR